MKLVMVQHATSKGDGYSTSTFAPIILVIDNFHWLSKETWILKIGQFLAKLHNYDDFLKNVRCLFCILDRENFARSLESIYSGWN